MNKYFFVNEFGDNIWFDHTSNIIPAKVEGINGHDIEMVTSKGLNQIGDTVTNTVISSRTISIEGFIKGSIDAARKAMLKVIAPGVKGTLTVVKKNGEEYKIDVYVKKSPVISDGRCYQNFQVDFYCPYPYFLSGEGEKSVDINALIPNYRYPRDYSGTWKISTYQRSEFVEIYNEGNLQTGIKLVIKANGISKGLTITNVTTGEKFILLDYTFEKGDEVTITTGYNNKRVVSSVYGNIFGNVDITNSTFFQLAAGQNTFKVESSGKQNLDIRLYYEEVFTSI